MQMINGGAGGIFFLGASGGTGKTILITSILAAIQSKYDIALAFASSRIAAILLPDKKAAHSVLKLHYICKSLRLLRAIFLEHPICVKYYKNVN